MLQTTAEELRVGFIDDKADFLDHLEDQQRMRGIRVKMTSDPEECLQWIRQGEVDLLVVDLRMPDIGDGLDLLEQAQNIRNIEGMILTGYEPTQAERQQATNLGVRLLKKDDLDELLDDLMRPRNRMEILKMENDLWRFKQMHQEWVDDLVKKLKRIPDLEEAIISSEEGPFTVAELIDDIKELRPRGREYVRLWRRALDTLLKLEKKS